MTIEQLKKKYIGDKNLINKKKGGSMPRAIKLAFWIMLLILFWHFVVHIDQIVLFFLKGGI